MNDPLVILGVALGVLIVLVCGVVIGALWVTAEWDSAMRSFEPDGEHDGSPWYRIARRVP